jgi:hypothetical protein
MIGDGTFEEHDLLFWRLREFASRTQNHEAHTLLQRELTPIVVLECATLDHDLHPIDRHTGRLVDSLFEDSGRLRSIEGKRVRLPGVFNRDGD